MTSANFRWNDASVASALGTASQSPDRRYGAISTDTRTLGAGDVFVALEGERFDGHDFVDRAIESGCGALVVRRDPGPRPVPVHLVPDTLTALGDLARHRRGRSEAVVVAITGSSGKTTVRKMVSHVVLASHAPHSTSGNENNRVGVPLTILSMPDSATALVVEMGASERGEIAELARIARPGVGVVTTVSETHIEGLGDLAGVLDEKLALIRALGPADRAIVGDDPPELAPMAQSHAPMATVCGLTGRAHADHRPGEVASLSDGRCSFSWRGHRVELQLPGLHNVYNALLALAVSCELGVPARDAAQRISEVGPAPMRGEMRNLGEVTLLVDCYNANPKGVLAALGALRGMERPGRRVAVLGTMLELGERSAEIHRDTLTAALGLGPDLLVLTGAFAEAADPADDPRIRAVADPAELVDRLPGLIEPGDRVLLKASRGIRLERVIPALEDRFAAALV